MFKPVEAILLVGKVYLPIRDVDCGKILISLLTEKILYFDKNQQRLIAR